MYKWLIVLKFIATYAAITAVMPFIAGAITWVGLWIGFGIYYFCRDNTRFHFFIKSSSKLIKSSLKLNSIILWLPVISCLLILFKDQTINEIVADGLILCGACISLQKITHTFVYQLLFWTGVYSITYYNQYKREVKINKNQIYPIIILTFIGGLNIFGVTNMLVLYLIFEIMSLGFGLLVAHNERDSRVSIGAFRYYTFSSIASMAYLYGVVLIYKTIGTVDLNGLYEFVTLDYSNKILLNIGLILIICALCTKVGLAPFHNWMPMAYASSQPIVSFLLLLIWIGFL